MASTPSPVPLQVDATSTSISSEESNLRKRYQQALSRPYDDETHHDEAHDEDDDEDYLNGSTTAVDSDSPLSDYNLKGSSYKYSGSALDTNPPDDFIKKTLRSKPLPPVTLKNWYKEINWISTIALTLIPVLSVYGALTTPVNYKTVVWSVIYYFYTGLGITAGYHRLWAHRCYNASLPLQYFLALGGSGAVQGAIRWWSRGHRAHHRYTDTDLDPYSAHKGLMWSHIGWMIVKPRRKPGHADVSDLDKNPVVRWQYKYYLPLILIMGLLFPMTVAGLGWGDWRGGFFFAGAARLLFVHHSTFCVNSLAHWLGDAPFDDKHTPRDHIITAFVTIGEGYHNYHHEFPQDFRNAIKWYQYDPTKWFISFMAFFGLASHLKTFPDNEVRKGRYNMELKRLQDIAKEIKWPKNNDDLPVVSWEEFQEQAKTRKLVVIGGYIHDVALFLEREEHPGGNAILRSRLGKDATNAFSGGVYDHSNAAHNLLSMMRVGCIEGGYEVESLKKKPNLPYGVKVYDGPSLQDSATVLLKPAGAPGGAVALPTSIPVA